MAEHRFQLRSTYRYGDDKNKVEDLQAQILTADGWRVLSRPELADAAPAGPGLVETFMLALTKVSTYSRAPDN